TDWLHQQRRVGDLPIGYFGASTGAAAALIAAAERPAAVSAVVSRGGRPDLAGTALGRVTAPTLLIVGSQDHAVISMNRAALAQLEAAPNKELVLVEGATHLFSEPGALQEVSRLARQWFQLHVHAPVGTR
ncbi:MAG TPA: dienelactone hydrolase family protein, partial [Planctomycetaceae bacterium]